jgi:pimeloyl-ACP methyl ester carboxylesterase
MSTDAEDARIEESVVVLEAASGHLVAFVTRSRQASDGPSVVLCPGGWYGTSTNRNRVFVRLARRLAAGGATVVRFDWHGVGESAGVIDRYVLNEPFVDDVVSATSYLEAQGYDDVTLVGVCFGARSALAAAPLVPHLRRLILMSFPVPSAPGLTKADWIGRRHGARDWLRLSTDRAVLAGLLDPNVRRVYRKAVRMKLRAVRRQSGLHSRGQSGEIGTHEMLPHRLRRQFLELDRRGVDTQLVFGDEDIELAAFGEFVDEALRAYLDSSSSKTVVSVVPGNIHGFDTLAVQSTLIELLVARILGQRSAI